MNDLFTELCDLPMPEDNIIFIESSDFSGILYQSYAPLLIALGKFVDKIDDDISRFIKKPDESLAHTASNIRDFKLVANDVVMSPVAIDPETFSAKKQKIIQANKQLDAMLSKLGGLRSKIAFGGNFIRSIILRPKIYTKNYKDKDRYDITNTNMRTVARALDWAEKITLELMNLVDQDLNLLTLVSTIYMKNRIYESATTVLPGKINRVTSSLNEDTHFIKWFFNNDEFDESDIPSFDYSILIDSGNNHVFGYYINDRIEGIIRLVTNDTVNFNKLSMLFVNEAMKSTGIGNQLLQHVITESGEKQLQLNVFADNDRAIRLYRKNSFVVQSQATIEFGEDKNQFVGKTMYTMTNQTSTTNSEYDPPMSPDKLPEHLRSDNVHMWRAMTGIELIHQEPSRIELDRIWRNWAHMTQLQKSISDAKSLELFKVNNEDHYNQLIGKYPDNMDKTSQNFIESSDIVSKEPISAPKKIDNAESPKNGVKRKELYIAFIEYAKSINPKNTFGSIFDKDAFTITYPFIPDEMRYFYRLANPLLCVLPDKLTFFALSELRKINAGNKNIKTELIFAASDKLAIVFNLRDRAIYSIGEATIEPTAEVEVVDEPIVEEELPTNDADTEVVEDPKSDNATTTNESVQENTSAADSRIKLSDTFDQYIQSIANVRII